MLAARLSWFQEWIICRPGNETVYSWRRSINLPPLASPRMQSALLCAFDDLYIKVTMRALHKVYCVAVTTILLQLLASCSAAHVEDDVGMPPGSSLGDHACIHEKVNTKY